MSIRGWPFCRSGPLQGRCRQSREREFTSTYRSQTWGFRARILWLYNLMVHVVICSTNGRNHSVTPPSGVRVPHSVVRQMTDPNTRTSFPSRINTPSANSSGPSVPISSFFDRRLHHDPLSIRPSIVVDRHESNPEP
jgi:hypothetical protein